MYLQGKENAHSGNEELCEMVFYGELTIDEANDLVIAFTPETNMNGQE